MDILPILTYTAICIAVFKIFKIPLNKWTVPVLFWRYIFNWYVTCADELFKIDPEPFQYKVDSLTAQLTLFDTDPDSSTYVAWFRQNSMLHLKTGDEAKLPLTVFPV